jgi:hypothetical protein
MRKLRTSFLRQNAMDAEVWKAQAEEEPPFFTDGEER